MEKAKVYEIKEPPYTHLVLFRKSGFPSYKRKHRDSKSAKACCDEFNETLLAEGATAVQIDARMREEVKKGLSALRGTGLSLYQACEIARDHWNKSRGGRDVYELIFKFLEGMELEGKSDRTIASMKSSLNALNRAGVSMVSDLNKDRIQSYLEKIRHGTTRRNHFARISEFCKHLVFEEFLEVNPCDSIRRPRREPKSNVEIFEPEEAETFLRILEKAKPDCVGYFAVLLFGMLRPSEAENLRPEDLRAGTIRVTKGKMRGRSRRLVEVTKQLRAWLDAYSFFVPSDRQQRAARKMSPRPWKEDICRHTGISCLLAATDDVNFVARQAGNSPEVIYSDYYELIEPDVGAKFLSVRPSLID